MPPRVEWFKVHGKNDAARPIGPNGPISASTTSRCGHGARSPGTRHERRTPVQLDRRRLWWSTSGRDQSRCGGEAGLDDERVGNGSVGRAFDLEGAAVVFTADRAALASRDLRRPEQVVFLGPPGTCQTRLAIGRPSAPAKPALASRSPPRRNGSTASPPPTTPARCMTSSAASAAPARGHRRGRLHPLRSRSRQPVLPARLRPLRTRPPSELSGNRGE